MESFEHNQIVSNLLSLLNEEEKKTLFSHLQAKTFNAKELIVKEGDFKNSALFILEGLIRCFKIKENGEEVTLFVRVENQFLTILDTVFFKKSSTLNYQAYEATSVLTMDFDILEEFIKQNPRLGIERNALLVNNFQESLELNQQFILLSPEERYIKFRDNIRTY